MSVEGIDLVRIGALTGATAVRDGGRLQTLWSGYGEIRRLWLEGAQHASVVVKAVRPPRLAAHRHGWNTERSHQRKLRSYDVEMAWYLEYAPRCAATCRVPRALYGERVEAGWLFVLEDLDGAGFAGRRQRVTDGELDACLDWLAHFHATFMGTRADGLWETGTYWHLATRPEELDATQDGELRQAAAWLDARLSGCRFQTLVHGDAKLANFCFREDAAGVAALDFQYVGGGCGMKDVAYLLSCLDSADCDAGADAHLERYFQTLRGALKRVQPELDVHALEAEWRAMYPLAWADFSRFLSGWAPGHHKLHAYAERMTRKALQVMGGG